MLDYKRLIKRRKTRTRILRALSFIPDKSMLKIQYLIKTGHWLNLRNPKRYTEKLQWYKLYYRDPLMVKCVDKYDVRDYVISKGLEKILVPCYGVFDTADEIDWNALPSSFVMKDTLGGGGTSVIVVKDKSAEDLEKLRETAHRWICREAHAKGSGREWPYYCGKKHRIIFEQYLDADIDKGGLIDYKFLCFNGKTAVVYILADRKLGQNAGCGIFDDELNKLPCMELDERPLERVIEKPENYELMKSIAEKLSEDFPEARIDLYDDNGQIKFGEITYYDSSGYMLFKPDSFDFELGNKFKLPENKLKNRGGTVGN